MAAVKQEIRNQEVCPPGDEARQVTSAEVVCSQPARKTSRGFFKTLFKALRSRKRQVTGHPPPKSAQDWRNELQTRNPWWGSGL